MPLFKFHLSHYTNPFTLQVSESILSLMSHDPTPGQEMPHVDRVFTSMDRDGDGVLGWSPGRISSDIASVLILLDSHWHFCHELGF